MCIRSTTGGGSERGEAFKTMRRADWAVAMTEPMREFYAASNLRRSGTAYYLPVMYDAKQLRRFPLFKSYIFVHCPSRCVGDISYTLGIVRVIMAAEVPLMVPNEFIDSLKAKENENGVIHLDGCKPSTKKYPVFKRGDCVRLNNAPFTNLSAVFDCASAHERARVLMEWMGQMVPVTVPIEQIEAA